MLFLLFCSYVLAAPSDDLWVTVTQDGVMAEDAVSDAKHVDLVGPLWWDVEEERFWLRVVLAELDATGEVGVLWLNASDVPYIGWRCTVDGCSVATVVPETPLDTSTWSIGSEAVEIRVLDEGGHDLAFGVPRASLRDVYGISDVDSFRVAVFTLQDGELDDQAFCKGVCDWREMVSDFMDLDRDEDGLSTAREAWFGSNPDAVDTDGDGLVDGDEFPDVGDEEGVYAVLDCDSDGDGLSDGLEAGVKHLLR